MIYLIHGFKEVARTFGYIAEVCSNCRQVRAMKVTRLSYGRHVYYVASEPGQTLGYTMECETCKTQVGVEMIHYPRVSRRKGDSLEKLARQTNPSLFVSVEQATGERQRLMRLQAPFDHCNLMLKERYMNGSRHDWRTGLAALMLFGLTYAIGRQVTHPFILQHLFIFPLAVLLALLWLVREA